MLKASACERDRIYRLLLVVDKGNWAYAGKRLATCSRKYPKLLSFSDIVFVDSGERERKLHMLLVGKSSKSRR